MQDRFTVLLIEPKYDGNVGSIARVMANFGFENLAMVNPCEIGADGRKKSMHARYLMESAKVYESFDQAAADFDFLVGTSAQTASDSSKVRFPVFVDELDKSLDTEGRIALVFGREDTGLVNEEIMKCDVLTTIPAHHKYPTLNLAQSVGIVLYELSRLHNKNKSNLKKFRKLSKIEKDTLFRFYDTLVDKIYDRKFENSLAKKTFKNVISRSFISGRESKTLTGLVRKAGERIEPKTKA